MFFEIDREKPGGALLAPVEKRLVGVCRQRGPGEDDPSYRIIPGRDKKIKLVVQASAGPAQQTPLPTSPVLDHPLPHICGKTGGDDDRTHCADIPHKEDIRLNQ